MIDELYELSKKAIASGIHVSFEIGLAGYSCRVWVEEPTESKMTTYDIYRDEALMKESVKNYEAAKEQLTRLLKAKVEALLQDCVRLSAMSDEALVEELRKIKEKEA